MGFKTITVEICDVDGCDRTRECSHFIPHEGRTISLCWRHNYAFITYMVREAPRDLVDRALAYAKNTIPQLTDPE